jgi:hypothetical protein
MSDAAQEGPCHLQQAGQDQKVGRLDTAPASAYQTFNSDASNLRVVSLEGIRASPTFNAFSDKRAAMGRFAPKRLFAAVRIAAHPVARARPPPPS